MKFRPRHAGLAPRPLGDCVGGCRAGLAALSLVGPRFLPGGARPPPDGPASPSCSLSSPTPPAGLALLARLRRRRAVTRRCCPAARTGIAHDRCGGRGARASDVSTVLGLCTRSPHHAFEQPRRGIVVESALAVRAGSGALARAPRVVMCVRAAASCSNAIVSELPWQCPRGCR